MAEAGWQEESGLQSELALCRGAPLSPTALGARDYLFLKLGFWAWESENWACIWLTVWPWAGDVASLSFLYREMDDAYFIRLLGGPGQTVPVKVPVPRHVQAAEQSGAGDIVPGSHSDSTQAWLDGSRL